MYETSMTETSIFIKFLNFFRFFTVYIYIFFFSFARSCPSSFSIIVYMYVYIYILFFSRRIICLLLTINFARVTTWQLWVIHVERIVIA